MSILTFNFHGLAGVQVESEDTKALHFFQAEYGSASAPIIDTLPRVELKWRRRKGIWPDVSSYHFQSHKCLARWSYRIELGEHGIAIDVFGNQTAIPIVHHMMVHPSLRYLCTQANALMLHGSAVVNQNRSLIFTGAGGTGKTTISSLILMHGGKEWNLHADDYAFLTKGPKSFSYVTRSHLYRDQIRWLPSIKTKLSLREKLHLAFFGRLREITRDGIKWPLRIEATRLWPEQTIVSDAQLAAIILLDRNDIDYPNLEKISPTEAVIQGLLDMNFFEARHFIRLCREAFGGKVLEEFLEEWKKEERRLLNQILQETSLYRLILPASDTSGGKLGRELIDLFMPVIHETGVGDFDG